MVLALHLVQGFAKGCVRSSAIPVEKLNQIILCAIVPFIVVPAPFLISWSKIRVFRLLHVPLFAKPLSPIRIAFGCCFGIF